MLAASYIWLLLCYAQNARSNLMDEYDEMLSRRHSTDLRQGLDLYPGVDLPVELGVEPASGCTCRSNDNVKIVVCFGSYECRRFPKIKTKSDVLRVRTTVMVRISRGDLDHLNQVKVLDIEANHKLTYIEVGTFRNLSNLSHLSISYNTKLYIIEKDLFEGLTNLRNLTLVNNGFTNILHITPAFRPAILPALRSLDISENSLETIPEHAFAPMQGSLIKNINIGLCRLEYIHENSFLPLKNLKELLIGENDLSPTLIGNFLYKMNFEGINLTHLDLSGMGFRKYPPKKLMSIIANSTIKSLSLAQNQFELIGNDAFPKMNNIELLDLRKVLAISVASLAFDPKKFPNLKALFLSGNNLPGVHTKQLSPQLLYLDLSNNKGKFENPLYYEIDRNTFIYSKELRVLNLSFNRIKSIFDYTFQGLNKLVILNLENGTLFHIGPGTFKPMKRLKMLNLANNPLTANENMTSSQYEGLNELKVLILKNCGIKHFNIDDNIFEMMPNLTHLILKNNQLFYISPETLKPLKSLLLLDLSENLLTVWWRPLFLTAGVRPLQLYLTNNKISLFSVGMLQDINYILENRGNQTAKIELVDNIFTCDCSTMFKTSLWLEANGSTPLRHYFANAKIRCSSPDIWEYRKVAEYLAAVKRLNCFVYENFNHIVVYVWTAPTLIGILVISLICIFFYRYRMYLRYWLFLAKIAIGRKFIRNSLKTVDNDKKVYKYDAFVSYSNEDREFVSEVITQLESNPPYLKLCIFERDFEIGSFISESVLSSINESKFVLLIISNNFAKSRWCRWETQLAEYHRLFLEDGSPYDPLVLIKLGEIENKYLTTTLKYLLKTKIYHLWDENHQNEFWKKLRNVLTKEV